jgi:hypothetical protein
MRPKSERLAVPVAVADTVVVVEVETAVVVAADTVVVVEAETAVVVVETAAVVAAHAAGNAWPWPRALKDNVVETESDHHISLS